MKTKLTPEQVRQFRRGLVFGMLLGLVLYILLLAHLGIT